MPTRGRSAKNKPGSAGSARSAEARILDGAIRCASSSGLDNVLIDDIVRESGVSRATIYRRFGNREGVLRAMILEQAQPYIRHVAEIASGSGTLMARLQDVIVATILSFRSYPWSRRLFEQGVSRGALSLFESLAASFRESALAVLIEQAAIERHIGIDMPLDRLHDWLLRQMLFIGEHWRDNEAAIRSEVSQLIMPVLLADGAHGDSPEDLASALLRIEQALAKLKQAIAMRPTATGGTGTQ